MTLSEPLAHPDTIAVRRLPSGTYRLHATLWVPRNRDELFPFFADAFNLEQITPPWLNFHVITPRPIAMRKGCLIDYRLSIRRIPVRWRTEITEWNPPFSFIDEQLKGPYRLWKHRHTFEERDGGTLMEDIVEYAVVGGGVVNRLFVQSQVETIFRYRQARLQTLFPPAAGMAGHS